MWPRGSFPISALEVQNVTTIDPCGVLRESVYEKRKDEFGVVQSFYLAQGSILLVISGYTTDEYAGPMRPALETVLASVQFSSAAPRSLRDLYALGPAVPSPSGSPAGNTSVPRPSTAQPHVEPGESLPTEGPIHHLPLLDHTLKRRRALLWKARGSRSEASLALFSR